MINSSSGNDFASEFHSETFIGKLVRLPFKLIPKGLTVKILSGVAKGMYWNTGAHVNGCWLGTYEIDKQLLCEKLTMPNMIVYDIGANAGFYSLIFSRLVQSNGKVIAFEPDSNNISDLRKHLVINDINNVTIIQAAVSDNAGVVGFSTTGGATGKIQNKSKYLIPTIQLDELIEKGILPPPDLIKMDVEGSEAKVLIGAKKLIKQKRCNWLVALHGEEQKDRCFSTFKEAGYVLNDLYGNEIDITDFVNDEFLAVPNE